MKAFNYRCEGNSFEDGGEYQMFYMLGRPDKV